MPTFIIKAHHLACLLRKMDIFKPQQELSERDTLNGLRMMTLEGMASLGYTSIITSGFLAAYALAIGANNFQIGVLAALPFILQPLQIPAITLVEKLRQRKLIAVLTWSIAQLLWIPVAIIPIMIKVQGGTAVTLLLLLMGIRGVFSAVTTCSYNSWIRDLVPGQILGRFFSRRMALSTIVASIFGLGAAFFVDYWYGHVAAESAVLGYTWVLLFGALFLGLASPFFMSRIPEPLMPRAETEKSSLWDSVTMPLHDRNFRKLMTFLLLWGIALNMAVPFFAIYMLQRLGLPLSMVIGLYVLGQYFNILFLRVWGPLSDRFGSKAVLSLCASLYLLVILGWTFTTMPDQYFLTIPLLIALHIFAGIATAGVSLTVTTIGFKLAPQAQSAPYLVGASTATSFGAGIGPIAGGIIANFFAASKLELNLTWIDPTTTVNLGFINLAGFDFLFLISFITGMITLNMLGTFHEEGSAERDDVLGELRAQTSSAFESVSSVTGSSFLSMFPLSLLNRVPGVDVAIGVTAYQVANTMKKLTSAVLYTGKTTVKIAKTLQTGLTRLWETNSESAKDEFIFASEAARGAFLTIDQTPVEFEQMISPSIVAIASTLKRKHKNPYTALRGAAYGFIEAAGLQGNDLAHMARAIIRAAGETARILKLREDDAIREAACGIAGAADVLGPQAVTQVTKELPKNLDIYPSDH